MYFFLFYFILDTFYCFFKRHIRYYFIKISLIRKFVFFFLWHNINIYIKFKIT